MLVKFDLERVRRFSLIGTIILIGVLMRLYVISDQAEHHIDSYYSMSKVTLKYDSVKKILRENKHKWIDSDQFTGGSKMAVDINFCSLNEQLNASNHPPVYYYFLHTILGITKSKSISNLSVALGLNLIFWVLAALLFVRLCYQVFENWLLTYLALAIYSFSLSNFSIILLAKSYVLLELLFLGIVFLIVRTEKCKRMSIWILVQLFGLMTLSFLTHYFAYLFICTLAFVGIIWIVIQGEYLKKIWPYILVVLSAGIVANLLYPNTFRDVISDKVSRKIQTNDWGLETRMDIVGATIHNLNEQVVTMSLMSIAIGGLVYLIIKWIKTNKGHFEISRMHIGVLVGAYGLLSYLFVYQFVPHLLNDRYSSAIIPYILIIPPLLAMSFLRNKKFIVFVFVLIIFLESSFSLYQVDQGAKGSNGVVEHWKTYSAVQDSDNSKEAIVIMSNRFWRGFFLAYALNEKKLFYVDHEIEYEKFKLFMSEQIGKKSIPFVLIKNGEDVEKHLTELKNVGFELSGKLMSFDVYTYRED